MTLAPQRETKVTEEIRNPMGWIVGRTERLGRMTALPEVQEVIQRVVTHLDAFCAVEDIELNDLQGQVIPTRALRYITIWLGGRSCWACKGTGSPDEGRTRCDTCEGTGIR